jgi:hypothetical protein
MASKATELSDSPTSAWCERADSNRRTPSGGGFKPPAFVHFAYTRIGRGEGICTPELLRDRVLSAVGLATSDYTSIGADSRICTCELLREKGLSLPGLSTSHYIRMAHTARVELACPEGRQLSRLLEYHSPHVCMAATAGVEPACHN